MDGGEPVSGDGVSDVIQNHRHQVPASESPSDPERPIDEKDRDGVSQEEAALRENWQES